MTLKFNLSKIYLKRKENRKHRINDTAVNKRDDSKIVTYHKRLDGNNCGKY